MVNTTGPGRLRRELVEPSRVATHVGSVCRRNAVLTPKGRVRLDAIDRDPATGEVRGVLCPDCRTGVAALGRDPERIRRAAAHLDPED